VSGAKLDPQERFACIDLRTVDDLDLVARTLDRDEIASHEMIARHAPALRGAARDANELLSESEIDALIDELWRSILDNDMRGLRAFDSTRGARFLSWLTVRLSRLAFALAAEPDQPTMLRVEEVAQRWGIDRKTVYSMISRGQLAARRCGRLVRIPRNAVESFEIQAGGSPEKAVPCR
jgi:excisionase family DNA binding protein